MILFSKNFMRTIRYSKFKCLESFYYMGLYASADLGYEIL